MRMMLPGQVGNVHILYYLGRQKNNTCRRLYLLLEVERTEKRPQGQEKKADVEAEGGGGRQRQADCRLPTPRSSTA